MARDNPEQYAWFKPFDTGVAVASMLIKLNIIQNSIKELKNFNFKFVKCVKFDT